MPVTENKNFLAHVNSLRGLAILLVFLFHLAPAFCPGGYYGVDVFFVISGYFLAASTLARMEQGRFSWRHYYVGKLSRLVPSVLVLVALVTAAGLVVMPAVDLEKIADLALSLLGAQSNRYFAERALDYFGTDVRDNPLLHTWYISVWIQILIAAPLVCLLLSRLPRGISRALLLLAGLASLAVFFQRLLPTELAEHLPSFVKDGGSAGSVYYMTLGRLWEVIAGALLYLLTTARPSPRPSAPRTELTGSEVLSSAPSCPAPAPSDASASRPDHTAENSPKQPVGGEALSPQRPSKPEGRFLSRAFTVAGLLLVLAAAALWEKYRTVHGGMRLPARIIRCQRQGPKNRRQSGGYCFVVEFTTPDGIRHTAATNDSFWFDQTRRVGTVIEVWYNPASPTVVERRSLEAELLGALFIALGFAVIFWLGLT